MDCEPWPVDRHCIPEDWPKDPETAAHFVLLATEMLHAASGRTVGVCRYTVRPCNSRRDDPCQGVCGCAPVCYVRIGRGQVQCVEHIRINGEYLPRMGWRLYDDGTVVLTHNRCFPGCQDLSRSTSEPGTWEITYLEGNPVNLSGSRAVTALAAQLARECAKQCGVQTRNLQSTNVEGESRTFDTLDARYGSIPEVEDWLQTVNPYRSARQAAVFSLDDDREWREIGYESGVISHDV